LDDHRGRRVRRDGGTEPLDGPRGERRQVLVRAHEAEVGVRDDAEHAEHLIEHLPVLAGGHHHGPQGPTAWQLLDDRRKLDDLRPRAEADEDVPSRGAEATHHATASATRAIGSRDVLAQPVRRSASRPNARRLHGTPQKYV
jgi:hypothetical protein